LFELKKGKQIKDQENRLSSPWIKFEQGKSQPVLWKLLINIYIVIFLYRLFFLYSVGIPNGNLQNLWRHLMNYGSLFNSYWWILLEKFRGKNQQKKGTAHSIKSLKPPWPTNMFYMLIGVIINFSKNTNWISI
jgi:hypothetical protein